MASSGGDQEPDVVATDPNAPTLWGAGAKVAGRGGSWRPGATPVPTAARSWATSTTIASTAATR